MNKTALRITLAVFFFISLPLLVQAHEIGTKHEHQAAPQQISQLKNLNEEIVKKAQGGVSLFGIRLLPQSSEVQAELKTLVEKRKNIMLDLLKKDPRVFIKNKLPATTRQRLSKDIQALVEQDVTVQGKTNVLHVDDFEKPENSSFRYILKTAQGDIEFHPTREIPLTSNTTLKVTGVQLGTEMALDTDQKTAMQVLASAPAIDSIGDQKMLVFLIEFANSGPRPFTRQQAYDRIFNGTFQKFYKEQSYNKISFSGQVFDWMTIPRNVEEGTACWKVKMDTPEIQAFIKNNNINLSNFGRVLFLVNGNLSDAYVNMGCGDVGRQEMTINDQVYRLSISWGGELDTFNSPSWSSVSWNRFDQIVTHEVGHNLGLMHANGWDCQPATLYGNCEHIEYGNYFDDMGIGRFSLHFNAFYKELLGWINPQNVVTITQAGRYTINPLELNSGKQFAKILMPGSTTPAYYLEYRKALGYDADLNTPDWNSNQTGLIVNRILPYPAPFVSISRLLDMSPQQVIWRGGGVGGATLDLNMPAFVDKGRGITIGPIKTVASSSITFDVAYAQPICVQQAPHLIMPFLLEPGIIEAGESIVQQVSFLNPSSALCGNQNFTVTVKPPAGITASVLDSPSLVTLPATADDVYAPSGYEAISITTSSSLSPGIYSVPFTVRNTSSGLATTSKFIFNVRGSSETQLSLTSTSTLSLQFNPNGSEAAMQARFNISFITGTSAVKIPKAGAFPMIAIDTEGHASGFEISYPVPSRFIDDGDYYTVPANSSFSFTVTGTRTDLGTVFGGTYKASLQGIYTINPTTGAYSLIEAPTNQTNSLTIIGEVSPYINSLTPNPANLNATITLKGIRFAPKGNIIEVIDTNRQMRTLTVPSATGATTSMISFTPLNLGLSAAGTYKLQVLHPTTGRSNFVQFELRTDIIPGDANGDSRVDGSDFAILAGAFGTQTGNPNFKSGADFNQDGRVDGSDFAILASNFGRGAPAESLIAVTNSNLTVRNSSPSLTNVVTAEVTVVIKAGNQGLSLNKSSFKAQLVGKTTYTIPTSQTVVAVDGVNIDGSIVIPANGSRNITVTAVGYPNINGIPSGSYVTHLAPITLADGKVVAAPELVKPKSVTIMSGPEPSGSPSPTATPRPSPTPTPRPSPSPAVSSSPAPSASASAAPSPASSGSSSPSPSQTAAATPKSQVGNTLPPAKSFVDWLKSLVGF
ncbi:hypothetical protein KW782_04500 [Candidatus Parcubacteria bacterium]|nr:hypothetical protein [Candidatus Parcubacteria bacterium]